MTKSTALYRPEIKEDGIMGLRTLARTVARNQSYRKSGTTDMFDYFFTKIWREKGHPASGVNRPAKKPRRGRK